MSGGESYVGVAATVQAITPKAVRLWTEDVVVWVPRSLLHGASDIALRDLTAGQDHEFQIMEWFARREGLA